MTLNVVSPCHPRSMNHSMQANEVMGHQAHIRIDHSPVSASNYQRPSNQTFDMGSQYYNSYNHIITENPEEEELLDAIAKWQEQED